MSVFCKILFDVQTVMGFHRVKGFLLIFIISNLWTFPDYNFLRKKSTVKCLVNRKTFCCQTTSVFPQKSWKYTETREIKRPAAPKSKRQKWLSFLAERELGTSFDLNIQKVLNTHSFDRWMQRAKFRTLFYRKSKNELNHDKTHQEVYQCMKIILVVKNRQENLIIHKNDLISENVTYREWFQKLWEHDSFSITASFQKWYITMI